MMHAKLDWSGKPFAQVVSSGRNLSASSAQVGLRGQDSVSVSSMSPGLEVYCGYEAGALGYANGGYTTMSAVYSRFPAKKYLSVGRDVIDIEPGLASPGDAPGFVRNAKPPHAAKPVIYCSYGDLSAVTGALNAAGIARDRYFIWVALWDGSPAIPAGCDGKQYASNSAFDSDQFYSYMFGAVSPWPLAQGSTGLLVSNLQTHLNEWRDVTGDKYPLLTVDGQFGPMTAKAVAIAQVFFRQRGVTAGECTESLYNYLLATPAKPPAPPAPAPVKPLPAPARTHTAIASAGSVVTFTWAPVALAKGYQVQVEQGDTAPPVLDVATSGLTYTTPVLLPKTKYRWRVAVDEAAHAWTAWAGFETP